MSRARARTPESLQKRSSQFRPRRHRGWLAHLPWLGIIGQRWGATSYKCSMIKSAQRTRQGRAAVESRAQQVVSSESVLFFSRVDAVGTQEVLRLYYCHGRLPVAGGRCCSTAPDVILRRSLCSCFSVFRDTGRRKWLVYGPTPRPSIRTASCLPSFILSRPLLSIVPPPANLPRRCNGTIDTRPQIH